MTRRPEVTGKKLSSTKPGKKKAAAPAAKPADDDDDDDDADSYTVGEFCRRNKVSLQLFYKDRANMPVGYRVRTKVLISKEEAREWRAKRTEAAKSQPLVTDLFHKTQKHRRAVREQAEA